MTNDIELPDDEAVELSNDMRRAVESAAAKSDPADAVDDDTEADDVGEEDESEESDDDSGESDAAEVEESDADDEVKPRRVKRTARERIAELVKKKRDVEKAAFESEMKIIDLERRLSERESAEPAAPSEPDSKDFTYGEFDPAYQEALINYRVALKEREIRSEASKASQREENARAEARYKKRLAEVMEEGGKRFKNFEEAVESVPFDPHLVMMILDSDKAVDIAYHLSNNISELRDITKASVADRARMLGRLEGRYSAASAGKKKTKAPDTPGTRSTRAAPKSDAQYGPEDEDAFYEAFFG